MLDYINKGLNAGNSALRNCTNSMKASSVSYQRTFFNYSTDYASDAASYYLKAYNYTANKVDFTIKLSDGSTSTLKMELKKAYTNYREASYVRFNSSSYSSIYTCQFELSEKLLAASTPGANSAKFVAELLITIV